MTRLLSTTAALITVATCATAQERSVTAIFMVGSSTVFPLSNYVMERFYAETEFDSPTNFSTGTGGGNTIFCAGVGEGYPDLSGASSRWTQKRYDICENAGLSQDDITEMNIGFDGITLFNSKDEAPLSFTLPGLAFAVTTIDPADCGYEGAVPDITVLGPPESSGTRDAFAELVVEVGLEQAGCPHEIIDSFADVIDVGGAYIEGSENDDSMIDEVVGSDGLIGIAGYSFLTNNLDRVQGAKIEGVEPSFDNIAAGTYAVSRRLWFYVKNEHLDVIPGLYDFVEFYMSDRFIGEEGELISIGLIPLPAEERAAQQAILEDL